MKNNIKMLINRLKTNQNNPRIIKDHKFKQLVKSIQDFPQMMEKRPIVCVTDVDGKLYPLGGNMRLRALQELKYKEIPDTWVTLADDWTAEQRNEFIIKDNIGYGEWEWDTLANEWDVEQLTEWGLDIPMFETENEEEKELNESDLFDIELPFYTPSDVLPKIEDLAETTTTKKLIEKIEKLNITDDLKNILKIRASFFTDFNFQRIADFYAQQNNEIKEIFEDLGFVILAPKEALKKGFINLKEKILEE